MLNKKIKLLTFLTPLSDLTEFSNEIFNCFYRSSLFGDSQNLLTKVKRKEIFKTPHISKKIKYIDYSIIAEAFQITKLRDQWLI